MLTSPSGGFWHISHNRWREGPLEALILAKTCSENGAPEMETGGGTEKRKVLGEREQSQRRKGIPRQNFPPYLYTDVIQDFQ